MEKKIKKKKLKCVQCGARIGFSEDWTEENAKEEYKKNYPFDENMETEYDSLCDDCYNKYIKWHDALTSEEHDAIKTQITKVEITKLPEDENNKDLKNASLIHLEASFTINTYCNLKLDCITDENDDKKKIRDET